jgi:hypothetical protein
MPSSTKALELIRDCREQLRIGRLIDVDYLLELIEDDLARLVPIELGDQRHSPPPDNP